ncbi:hypothetical protein D3C86_1232160 [compost metagenome]
MPPWSPRTFTGIRFTSHASPATPVALFPAAPMIPAQWVPWPSVSRIWEDGRLGSTLKSAAATTRWANSGWVTSRPVSSTATITLLASRFFAGSAPPQRALASVT